MGRGSTRVSFVNALSALLTVAAKRDPHPHTRINTSDHATRKPLNRQQRRKNTTAKRSQTLIASRANICRYSKAASNRPD